MAQLIKFPSQLNTTDSLPDVLETVNYNKLSVLNIDNVVSIGNNSFNLTINLID